MSAGVMWASRVTTLGLELALPPLAGVYLDSRWHIKPVGTIVGAILGFAACMTHILRIARQGTD